MCLLFVAPCLLLSCVIVFVERVFLLFVVRCCLLRFSVSWRFVLLCVAFCRLTVCDACCLLLFVLFLFVACGSSVVVLGLLLCVVV